MQLRILRSLDDVRAEAWDALLDDRATPFLRHAWLHALEASGCASDASGWRARHLTAWRGRELVACAPAYLKEDSDGDFSRDWGWAEATERAGLAYYPKLVVGVPFTPVTGRRVLIAPGESREQAIAAIVDGARALAKREGATGVHVLFPLGDEAAALEAAGLVRRVSFQYHWRNDGYRDPEDFLARFSSKKRNQAKRERAAPGKQGIEIRTLRKTELLADLRGFARLAHELHRSTVDKLMWGRRWLNRELYERVFERMPDAIELVLAKKDDRVIAGAFNVATPTHLYGRYWGCFEEHAFLHFNVCLYHSIDECIRRGVRVFEGGAGGEHKIARGFEPAETWSAHAFLDERLQRGLGDYIAREAEERQHALARWRAESPILKPPKVAAG